MDSGCARPARDLLRRRLKVLSAPAPADLEALTVVVCAPLASVEAPVLPGAALGLRAGSRKSWFQEGLVSDCLAVVFLSFLVHFPEKAFLPIWLRIRLGH